MKKLHLVLTAMTTVAAGLLAPLSPSAAATAWNDGFHDEDTIINCVTGQPATGVHANVGWSSPTGQVPKVGERFMLRGYIGLVGLPCSSGVNVLPEIMVPAGVEFIDEPVSWDVTPTGEQQQLSQTPLVYDHGANGGYLIGPAPETAFTLERGDVLEFQFPVRATRELKGPATQQPMCQSRLDGDAPCPISQSGDHFQVAFTVNGHGGDKWYVTPFVGLFASAGTTTPSPTTTPITTPTTTPTTSPAPGTGKAASTTRATWKPSTSRKGRVTVVVSSAGTPTGVVVIKDKGRAIAKAVLKPSHRGRITLTLPRMRKGTHTLVASYRGSTTVSASSSAKRTVRLR
jgi:hypothetical protein